MYNIRKSNTGIYEVVDGDGNIIADSHDFRTALHYRDLLRAGVDPRYLEAVEPRPEEYGAPE